MKRISETGNRMIKWNSAMKKKFVVIGMIISSALVLLGILVITGALGGDTNYAYDAPYGYDSGYATFGGDFYTYAANNAEEAASASRTVAYNLDEIARLLKNAVGISLICFGSIGFCVFGIVRSGYAEDEVNAASEKETDISVNYTMDDEKESTELL